MSTQRRQSLSTSASHHVSSPGSGHATRNGEGEEDVDGRIIPRQSADPSHYQSSLPPQLARLTYARHSPRASTETHASSHLPPHLRSEDRSLRPVGLNSDIRNSGHNSERRGDSVILPPLNIGGTSRTVNTPARDDTRQSSHSRYVAERPNESNVRVFSPPEERRAFPTDQPYSSRSPYSYTQVAEVPDPVAAQRSTNGRQILSHGPLAANQRHNSPRPRSALDSAYLSDLSSTSVISSAHGGPPASTSSGSSSGWTAIAEYSIVALNNRFGDDFTGRRQSILSSSRRSPAQFERSQEADIDIPSGYRSLRVAMPVSTMRGGPAVASGPGTSSRSRGHGRPRGTSQEHEYDADTRRLRERDVDPQHRLQYDLNLVGYGRRGRGGNPRIYRGSTAHGRQQADPDEVFDFEYDEPPQASESEAEVEYEFEHRLHMQETPSPAPRISAQDSSYASSVIHESSTNRRTDVWSHHQSPGRYSVQNIDFESNTETPATVQVSRRALQDNQGYAPQRLTDVQYYADETPTYSRTSHRSNRFDDIAHDYGRSSSSEIFPREHSSASTSRYPSHFIAPVPRPAPALPLLTGESPPQEVTSAPPLPPSSRSTSAPSTRLASVGGHQRQQYNPSQTLPPLRERLSDSTADALQHERSSERPFVRQVPALDHQERYRVEPLQAQRHRWSQESFQSHRHASGSPSLTLPSSYSPRGLVERHELEPPPLHRVHSHDSASRDLGVHRSAFVRDVRSASPMNPSGVVHGIEVVGSTRTVLPGTSDLLAGVPAAAHTSVPIGLPVPLPGSVGVIEPQRSSGRTEVHLHIIHEDQYQRVHQQIVARPRHPSQASRSQAPPDFRSAPQTPTLVSRYTPEPLPTTYHEPHAPSLPPVIVPSQNRTDPRPLKRPKVVREIKEEDASPTSAKGSRRASSERGGRGLAGHRSSSDRLREGTTSLAGGSNAPSPATTQDSPFDSGGGERPQRRHRQSEQRSPAGRTTSSGPSDRQRPSRPPERPIVRLGATPPPPPVPPRDDNTQRVPRKKIDVACEFCRKRKMRCDGARPTCRNCLRKNVTCEYTPEVRRRGPGKKKKESTPRPKRTNRSAKSQSTGESGGEQVEQQGMPSAGPGPSTQAYLAQRQPSSGPSSSSPVPPGMLGMPPLSSSSSPWPPVPPGLPPFRGQGGFEYSAPPGQVPFRIDAREPSAMGLVPGHFQTREHDEDYTMGDDTNEGDDRDDGEDDDDDDEEYDEDEEDDEEIRIKRASTDDEDERGPPGPGGSGGGIFSSTSVKMEESDDGRGFISTRS